MIRSTVEFEGLALFLLEHLDDIVARAVGEDAPRARRETVTRMASAIVGRFLGDAEHFWEDISHTPWGLCAVFDALDELEHAVLQQFAKHPRRGLSSKPVAHVFDEVRSDYIRLTKRIDAFRLVDLAQLEHIPTPLFLLTAHAVGALNAAARDELARKDTTRCHELFFQRSAPCDDCPMTHLIDRWEHGRCPVEHDGKSLGLSPQGSTSMLAYPIHVRSHASSTPPKSPTGLAKAVIDDVGSGVLFAARSGQVLFANGIADRLLGAPAVGRDIQQVLPGAILAEDGKQRQMRLGHPSPRVLVGYRCVSTVLDGTVGTVVHLRDITETEAMRTQLDQLKLLSEMGQMCTVVAHEIRNPLAGIMATIQSIEPEAAAAGLDSELRTIEGEVHRLSELLNTFFDFVRQSPPRPRAVDLASVVDRALAAARPRLDDIALTCNVDATEPLWLDPDQVQQVLLNLFLNAADAMADRGRRDLRIEAVLGRKLTIHVIDSGCGISPEHLPRVLDPFYTTKPSGTGLGLAICQRIVSAHGGTVSVNSTPGVGTRVTVALPLFQPPARDHR